MGAGTGFDQNTGGGGGSTTAWTLYELQQSDITEFGGTLTLVGGNVLYKIDGNNYFCQILLSGTAASTISTFTIALPGGVTFSANQQTLASIPCVVNSQGGTFQQAGGDIGSNDITFRKISGNFTDGVLDVYVNVVLEIDI